VPETPSGLAEFEAIVMASAAPAVVLIDRALVRAWLRYTRRLERDVAETGEVSVVPVEVR
jgi:hypothetical protein